MYKEDYFETEKYRRGNTAMFLPNTRISAISIKNILTQSFHSCLREWQTNSQINTPTSRILVWLDRHEQQWLFRQQLVRLLRWCTAAWLWPGNKTAENSSQSRPLNYPVPVAAQSTHTTYITSLYTASIYPLHGQHIFHTEIMFWMCVFYQKPSPKNWIFYSAYSSYTLRLTVKWRWYKNK